MGVGQRKRRPIKKEMTREELQKLGHWKHQLENIVARRDLAKAIDIAISGKWISPGTGNLSGDASLKRMITNLKKHGIKTN